MIESIGHIEQIGRFEYGNYRDLHFTDRNLIFGINGCGKTTFAGLMHGVGRREAGFIEERHRIGADDPPKLVLSVVGDKTPIICENGEWSGPLEEVDLAVFDSHFVNENIYSGNVIRLGHKRRLHQFIIGAEGREIGERINQIDWISRRVSRWIREIESKIRQRVESGCSPEEFVDLEELGEPDTRIEKARSQLAAQRQAEPIRERDPLTELPWPDIPIEGLRELLGTTIGDIQEEARDQVQSHIRECGMEEGGEAWIQQGRTFAEEETCPFCGQDLTGNDLIEAYDQYFDERYEALTDEIRSRSDQIHRLLGEGARSDVISGLETNEARAEFWSDHISGDYDPDPELATEIGEAWTALRDALRDHVERKQDAPLKEITFDGVAQEALTRFQEASQQVRTYNEQIRTLNEEIAEVKDDAEAGSVEEAQAHLHHLLDRRDRHTGEGQRLGILLRNLNSLKDTISTGKQEAQDQLRTFQSEVLTGCEEAINQFLRRAGAEFCLTSSKVRYPGGKPSTEYALHVNGETIELGNAETEVGTRRFGNVLSDGDRSTLAFAFFYARLKQTEDLSDKTIVIDDPISSLDRHRRQVTRAVINELAEEADQIFVLSHSPRFLHGLWEEWREGEDLSLFRFQKGGDQTSELTEWPVAEMKQEVEDPYFQRFERLVEYDRHRSGDRRRVASEIRLVIEGNLARRFPEEVARGTDSIGKWINRIEEAESGDPLFILADERYLTTLKDIRDFCQDPHHTEDPTRPGRIDEDELARFVRDTLDFARGPMLDR